MMKKAMILAAGHGTRMRPLTDHTPKPLLQAGGKALIVWQIEKLAKAGFSDIIINIAWLGEKIPAALGNGADFGVNIHYSNEQDDGALETAGGIVKALPLLGDDPFLVVNGDIWSDYTYTNQSPLTGDTLAHLVLVGNPEHHSEGDFALSDNASISTTGDNKFTFSGIGYYHPDLFKDLRQGKRALRPLFNETIEQGIVTGEFHDGDWRDIGTPERLATLDAELSLK